ncbi:FAS1 domain-containing protein [Suillus fuscotomentosus]|uniref:FAS1 domain-containing protein n=1 Tax=Suillus fuscotomentosus TaxID=1912939 RepID=A0AAD4EDH0_9AGAM|nr:FAS1 domain-containing protein [Suillus fuscotomentosus]KAG1904036.1 FAS1 domain-containing protein [Suillus fuscotomentosus]
MRIHNLVPIFCVGGAYALPTLSWLPQFPVEGLVRCWGIFAPLSEDRTIYQVLKDDERYSRLVKAINLSDEVTDLLDDPAASITFFAVPNTGIPHRQPSHGDDDNHQLDFASLAPKRGDEPDITYDLGHLVLQVEELDNIPESRTCRIIRAILAYHILPKKLDSTALVQNSTYATNLTLNDGSMDYQPLRLSVQSTIRDTEASNGVIHSINIPLLPPPSLFNEMFAFPEVFSYVTSAIQHVGLIGAVDYWRIPDKDCHISFVGAELATFFAPTSGAFQRLPKKLRLFLFSPFGARALRKLLEYHVVPQLVLHTDYVHNATSYTALIDDREAGVFVDSPGNPLYAYNLTLPTLLENHSLNVQVARYKAKIPLPGPARYFTRFVVNGHDVGPYDIPARNGALHVITNLLDPRGHHKEDHKHRGHEHESVDVDWEDWEEWLPQWAMQD